MCNECLYKQGFKRRSMMMNRAAHQYGYYQKALQSAVLRDKRLEIEKYRLAVQILNEMIVLGKYR